MEYRLDLFAVFIFLGIVQAIFLSTFFFSKVNRSFKSNIFHGLLFLSLALSNLEIFLMYSGYIAKCLHLVDFSEPIAFVIGPSFYLMVISLIEGDVKKSNYLHFVFPVVYLLLVIPFFLEPEVVKYNAWIDSFHPELPFKPYDYPRNPRMFWVTDHHTDLTLISLVLYGVLSLFEIIKAFKKHCESFWKPEHPVLRKLKSGIIQVVLITIIIFVIKAFNVEDTGDHLFAAYISIIIYFTSFRVIGESGFFKQATLNDSKPRSAEKNENQLLLVQKLRQLMVAEKPFLNSDFSLPDLAQRLNTTVHAVSQAINDGLQKNFFEMTAEYRIAEAKKLLVEKRNIKVEEIAEEVGYNSKSSFNTAFKKITGVTPSEYRSLKEANHKF